MPNLITPQLLLGPSSNGPTIAPSRNRYFYGKLLDVGHLELEQRYFLDMGRLVNRLTLGAGVLCGLRVSSSNGHLVVTPGVAVDGLGREIIVTENVEVDPKTLLAGGQLPAEYWLCLNYHECEVEPAPALIADCEVRETCVPGVIRERYTLTVQASAPPGDPLQEQACNGLFAPGIIDPPVSGPNAPAAPADITTALQTISLATDPIAFLRRRLTAFLQPSCAAGQACVPLARVTTDTEGVTQAVDDVGPRTMVYSNAVLLDLILCLAEHIEECCKRKVTPTAPKIVRTLPAPGELARRSELQGAGGDFTIVFDRALNADRLAAPSEWLRAVVIVSADGQTVQAGEARGFAFFAPVELVRTDTPGPGSELEAVFRFVPVTPGSGDATTPPTAAPAGQDGQSLYDWATQTFAGPAGGTAVLTVVLVIPSDDIAQLVDTSDPPELLDADYAGTALSSAAAEFIANTWAVLSNGTYHLVSANTAFIKTVAPPGFIPPSLPSGNGIEGGIFHDWFSVTTE